MKKFIAIAVLAAFIAAPAVRAADEPGGFTAGVVGCCFGIRTAAAYNEGKRIHVRDVLDLFWFGRIWSMCSAWQGITTSDLQKEAPAYF